ncbi:glutamyl endopeptidase [Calothrix parasitica NIES-267]|uniref:Glutamyl endopeptidase n=1 Tax=Calothrix parasitica NIES-267 TaxID=1973488 RepID=A0A1Z4LS10_9CYAN|nr:glutamyl endopeptidase [Calothrix parasitica NIES-267]
MNINIGKQRLNLLISATLGIIAVTLWTSVKAQINPDPEQISTPKFTNAENADKSKFSAKFPAEGKPFKPNGLNQLNKIPRARGVIGSDDRIPMTLRKYPWSSIGRVAGITASGSKYHCTGTLIAENVVLTNSHCVVDNKTNKLSKKIWFQPNVINGKVLDSSDVATVKEVIYGTDFTQRNSIKNDWAVMLIDRPLGRKYGYLGLKNLPTSTFARIPQQLFFVGYSGDFPNPQKRAFQRFTAGKGWTAGAQQGCSIVGEEQEILLHDCDTAGGSSGGPIIAFIDNNPYIVALNNAEIKDRDGKGVVNLAVKISNIEKALKKD